MRVRLYHVYVLANRSRVLYVGVTGDLGQRLAQHRSAANPSAFTAQYHVDRLVYVEEYRTAAQAIAREKQIKSYRRAKKIALIERDNPEWNDLAPLSSRAV